MNNISPLNTARPIDFGTEQDIPADVVPHAVNPESAQRRRELSEQQLKA